MAPVHSRLTRPDVYATSQFFEIKFRGFAEKLPPPYNFTQPKSGAEPLFTGATAVIGAAVALLAGVAAAA